jgi:hypothetical protein
MTRVQVKDAPASDNASALIMAWSIAFLMNIKTYPTHLARLDQQPYDWIGWACVTGANGR